MHLSDHDLLAGALGLALRYVDVADLRRALGGDTLIQSLGAQGSLPAERAAKLELVTEILAQLRADACYGVVALENRFVGHQILNACMEESKREGCAKPLGELLVERGVLTPEQHAKVDARAQLALEDMLAPVRQLVKQLDPSAPREQLEDELRVVLGVVAEPLAFLQRDEIEVALQGRLGAEAPAAAPPPSLYPALAEQGAQAPEDQGPIAGFQLLERLGEGAMGAVVKARKSDTGEIVALKILKPELAENQENVDRFVREAESARRLQHPSIVRAVQAGVSGDYYYFAMEFVQGQTGSDLIKAQGKLPERFGLFVVRSVAEALAHAWEQGVVHRDIKPDNIMITPQQEVKLTDLGLATFTGQESTLTMTGVVVGSPAYISPEQATGGKQLDTRSDIYSLGASLYHMLTGEVPYPGEQPLHVMLMHLNEPVPSARAVNPEVSVATERLIQRMMAKKPADRFQSPAELIEPVQQIEDALAQGEVPPIPLALRTAEERKSASAELLQRQESKHGSGKGTRKRELGERLRRRAKERKRGR
ncbi:MAG: serine/threonine-protein kinase [Planctomycetota bacterium]